MLHKSIRSDSPYIVRRTVQDVMTSPTHLWCMAEKVCQGHGHGFTLDDSHMPAEPKKRELVDATRPRQNMADQIPPKGENRDR